MSTMLYNEMKETHYEEDLERPNEIDLSPKAVSDFFFKLSILSAGLVTIVGFNLHRVEETVFLIVAIICLAVSALCAISRVKLDAAEQIRKAQENK